MTGIQEAIDKAGSQTALAALLGVTRQSVQEWAARGFAPVDRVVEIEANTGVDRAKLVEPKLANLFEPF